MTTLTHLIRIQDNKCHYCGCEMDRCQRSDRRATIEHLLDKWASPGHIKIEDNSNVVAACFACNNLRGSKRNSVARKYYREVANLRNVKLHVNNTSSRKLFKMFGPVPQHLFN